MIVIARDQVREPLHVVVPYFNPWRHKSRVKHTERALKHFHDSGAVITLVEVGFNRRELVFKDSGLHGSAAECTIPGGGSDFRHQYIGLHTKDELWLKENAINVGVQNLPYGWQQVCWLDSDVHFCRPNWVGECIHKLQHFAFLQPFTHARDLGPNYEMLPEDYPHANGVSFVKSWRDGDLEDNLTRRNRRPPSREVLADLLHIEEDIEKLGADVQKLIKDLEGNYYGARRVFPGLAWACTREAWDKVGGLIDVAIWGGGDWHMAHALVDRADGMMHTGLSPNYKSIINEWHHRCQTLIRKNVGAMEGSILHMWHGKKTQRGYGDKHRILARLGFDPLRHLKRDFQGLYQLHDDQTDAFVGLRDEMRRIAKERNEDSIDI